MSSGQTARPTWRYVLIGLAAAVVTNLLANAIERAMAGHLPWWSWLLLFVLFAAALGVTRLWRSHRMLRRLGFVALHPRAGDTIERGLEEATTSYLWLGTSANYVINHPGCRDKMKGKTADFQFMTLDPEDSAAIAEQEDWQGATGSGLKDRLHDTGGSVQELKKRQVKNVMWKPRPGPSTLRVVVIDGGRKIYVSSYEKGHDGPNGEQIELDEGGLLSSWFRDHAQRMWGFPHPPKGVPKRKGARPPDASNQGKEAEEAT